MTTQPPLGKIRLAAALSGMIALAVTTSSAQAFGFKRKAPCLPVCPAPVTVAEPAKPADKPAEKPAEPTVEPEEPTPLPFDEFAALSEPTVALVDANGGYLDNALIRTRFRFRFDNASGNDQPSRAEYFYAKCGCFRTVLPPTHPLFDPNAFGPSPNLDVRDAGHVDYHEYLAYLEVAPLEWASGFVQLGIRAINPFLNDNTAGLGDMQAGFKAYLFSREDQKLTFQLKTYIPTGDSDRGLGTAHVSLEPGILYYRRIGDRVTVEAEFKDWIPIGGTDFAGNVLQYGGGVGYDVYRCDDTHVTPIIETVGWTILSGRKTDLTSPTLSQSAAGDTIVNVKLGARVGRGMHSVYAGYGFAVTGDEWYREIVRIEYRMNF